jgi:hypothetical protein
LKGIASSLASEVEAVDASSVTVKVSVAVSEVTTPKYTRNVAWWPGFRSM